MLMLEKVYYLIVRIIGGRSVKHNNPIYPNLIKEKIVTGINQVWYIHILSCFVYLAAILDIYSRIIVGYALGRTLKPKLTF